VSAGAAVVIALLCARSLLRPDDSWDAWAYHLPFAARLWNIVPRSSLELEDHLELLFRAYPVGVEWLQGALWKLTGRLQAGEQFRSAPSFRRVLHRRFAVGRAASVFALLAIPMVQIHATNAYVDLPGNLAAAAGILLTFRAWTAERPDPSDATLAALAAALAANAKFQMAPVAALVGVSLALLLIAPRREPAGLRSRLPCCSALTPTCATPSCWLPFFPAARRASGATRRTLVDYQGPSPRHWPGAARCRPCSGQTSSTRHEHSASTAPPSADPRADGGYFGPWVVPAGLPGA
jgi:hypothetical protein